MARVLIVDRAGRGANVAAALRGRDYAVREVEGDPLLPGHVFAALENVTVVCWLMGAGEGQHPEVNGEQLETVLLKVVDTGVRGFVFERPGDATNAHVEHARATWHIPIEEISAGREDDAGEAWLNAVCDAVDATLGIDR
ncbi:MAG: hypothetical protein HZB14_06320 [Actinobacteria bacterium]|nr:hypothetical protein [Actinomycetota bacterium]